MNDGASPMDHFLLGILATLATTLALFFLRFFGRSRDRLFAFFAAAFFVLGADWLAIAVVTVDRGSEHLFYGVRLVAFALIIAGIVDKNRRPG